MCVVAIIGLAYLFTKYVAGRGMLSSFSAERKGAMRVVAQMAVGKDRQLLLVKVGERYFLLGSTASGLSKLAELTPEEAEAMRESEDRPEDGGGPSFRQSFMAALRQRMKR